MPGPMYPGLPGFPQGPYMGTPPINGQMPGYPPQPQEPTALQTGEKIGGGLIKDFLNKGNMADKIPGAAGNVLGKVLPGMGAAAGTMGLIQGGGVGHNLLSGMEAGAGYGSFIPGIGTGIGALIGLGVGGLRSLFHKGPSQQELQGRGQQAQSVNSIIQGASQDQLSEAQGAMNSGKWKDLNSPLAVIVMRDHLMKTGMDPAQADKTAQSYMTNMWNAEKGGAQAVTSATPHA